jgi:ATP-dependent RNA helicase DDX56/DBP9
MNQKTGNTHTKEAFTLVVINGPNRRRETRERVGDVAFAREARAADDDGRRGHMETIEPSDASASASGVAAWTTLGLDEGVARALTLKKCAAPTAVQRAVIPAALAGRDVVARASTGSGKTYAYLAPTLHKIVARGKSGGSGGGVVGPRAIVLAPTRELAHQVRRACAALLKIVAPAMRCGELPAANVGTNVLRETAGSPPDVLVATPSRVAECARGGYFPPGALKDGLEMVVLDEADLLLSFGYVDDIKVVMKAVKRGTQVMMLSATMSKEIEELRDVVAHKPTTLDVEDDAADAAGQGDDAALAGKSGPNIAHYSLKIPKAVDRLLYCMALLRLGLCKKKVLVFVSNADAAVRLRLFLHKFGVPTCALHGELPANSRTHILQEFNRGVYDFMVAAADDANMKDQNEAQLDEDAEEPEDKAPTRESKKKKKDRRDKEFGVVRGIDFQAVHTVINFDVPLTAAAYVHRVGRTGRAGKSGTAITLVAPSDELAFSVIQEKLASEVGETVAATQVVKEFDRLPKEAVDALRYRAEDAARAVGKNAVKEARVRELRQELLNSERLAAHFEDNAEDLALLKHDTSLSKHPDAKHLSHLPGYLRGKKNSKAKEVEPDSRQTKAAANYHLDVEVAEFGSKKKRKRNDKRETGPDLRVKKFKKAFVKKKAGRKRSR